MADLRRQEISAQQLWFLLVSFLIGSSALLTPGTLIGREAWLAIMLSILPGTALALLYAWLQARFPGQTIVGVLRSVYGAFFGSLLAGAYLLYILHLGSLVISDFVGFLTTYIYESTPQWVIVAMFIAVAGYAAWSGVEVLARVSVLTAVLVVGVSLLDSIVLIGPFRLDRLLPLVTTPWPKLLWATWASLAFPLAEIVAFLMITPSIKPSRSVSRKYVTAVIAVGLLSTYVAFRNGGVLGRSIESYTYPSFEVLRIASVGEFLTRFELGLAVLSVGLGLVKVAFLYYASAVGGAELFRLADYRSLIVPLGGVLTMVGLQNFTSVATNHEFTAYDYPIYAGIFQIIIPLLTAIIAGLRHLPRSPSPTTARSS